MSLVPGFRTAAQFLLMALLLSLITANNVQADGILSDKDIKDWNKYQDEVIGKVLQMKIQPTRFAHHYYHHRGPLIEEYFFGLWSARRPALPQIYLPIGWSTYFWSEPRIWLNFNESARAKKEVELLLSGLDKRFSYFSIIQFAGLIARERISIPCDLKLTNFVGGGPDDAVHAPHIHLVPIPLLLEVLEPAATPRTQHVTFSGGFLGWQDPGGIRTQMQEELNDVEGYNITEKVSDWIAFMRSSNFHLCPRGFGVTSFRLYESLQVETIPIYIWSEVKWLPFADMVDWNSIAIIVSRDRMATIPSLVEPADVEAMRADIKLSRHMWRYEYTGEYIINHVKATRFNARLNQYHGNTTECGMETDILEQLVEATSERNLPFNSIPISVSDHATSTDESADNSGGSSGASSSGGSLYFSHIHIVGMPAGILLFCFCRRALRIKISRRELARRDIMNKASRKAAVKRRVYWRSSDEQRNMQTYDYTK